MLFFGPGLVTVCLLSSAISNVLAMDIYEFDTHELSTRDLDHEIKARSLHATRTLEDLGERLRNDPKLARRHGGNITYRMRVTARGHELRCDQNCACKPGYVQCRSVYQNQQCKDEVECVKTQGPDPARVTCRPEWDASAGILGCLQECDCKTGHIQCRNKTGTYQCAQHGTCRKVL